MALSRALVAALTGCALSSMAGAAISFTFSDPSGAREVVYTSSGVSSNIAYASDDPVVLTVDGADEGFGPISYNTTLTMSIVVGPAVGLMGQPNTAFAPITGSFIFSDTGSGNELLRGEFTSGGLVALAGAGALLTSSSNGLAYTASNELLTVLNNNGIQQLFGAFDAAFTLTDINPTVAIGGDNYLESFTANAAFSGTATVPGPAGFSVLALGALTALRRRRRYSHTG